MKIYPFVAVSALLLLAGCKGNTVTPGVDSLAPEDDFMEIVADTVDTPAPVADEKPVESYFERQAKRPAAKPQTPKAAPAKKPAAETIYVETDGAQGRVWGHVTMRGDRGTGTIHDWDENTLSVSVTRHGNELFAVDQNSRQYVFRLK